MHPVYYYRNMINPSYDDKPYINQMIRESIEIEYSFINFFNELLKKQELNDKIKIYKDIINDSNTHIRLLENIYGVLNNKKIKIENPNNYFYKDLNEVILKNIELSKINRKIMFGSKDRVNRLMMFDIIVDNINNVSLLNMILNKERSF